MDSLHQFQIDNLHTIREHHREMCGRRATFRTSVLASGLNYHADGYGQGLLEKWLGFGLQAMEDRERLRTQVDAMSCDMRHATGEIVRLKRLVEDQANELLKLQESR